MSSSLNDQLLASRQQTWNGFCKLLFWGSILAAVVTIIAVFAEY